MLQASELPSIHRFASDVWDALDEGELVVVSSPQSSWYSGWREALVAALHSVVRKKRDPTPTVLPVLPGDATHPVALLSRALDFRGVVDTYELLECSGRAPICIISVECVGSLSAEWKRLFSDIARIYRLNRVDVRQRPVLVMVIGCGDYPPIEVEVGVRVKALWNLVRWEETRLLIESRLRSNESSLIRAWRIAVYSATSNNDLDAVSILCEETPNSLSEAVECGLSIVESQSSLGRRARESFLPDQRWDVPPAAIAAWASGRLLGSSLERGLSLCARGISRDQAHEYFYSAIWREQVSGILPIVMEMSVLANEAARGEIGSDWIDADGDHSALTEPVNLEPREVIERISQYGGRRVSRILWENLQLLRSTRNDLAHMRPVDYDRVVRLCGQL